MTFKKIFLQQKFLLQGLVFITNIWDTCYCLISENFRISTKNYVFYDILSKNEKRKPGFAFGTVTNKYLSTKIVIDWPDKCSSLMSIFVTKGFLLFCNLNIFFLRYQDIFILCVCMTSCMMMMLNKKKTVFVGQDFEYINKARTNFCWCIRIFVQIMFFEFFDFLLFVYVFMYVCMCVCQLVVIFRPKKCVKTADFLNFSFQMWIYK